MCVVKTKSPSKLPTALLDELLKELRLKYHLDERKDELQKSLVRAFGDAVDRADDLARFTFVKEYASKHSLRPAAILKRTEASWRQLVVRKRMTKEDRLLLEILFPGQIRYPHENKYKNRAIGLTGCMGYVREHVLTRKPIDFLNPTLTLALLTALADQVWLEQWLCFRACGNVSAALIRISQQCLINSEQLQELTQRTDCPNALTLLAAVFEWWDSLIITVDYLPKQLM